MFLTDFNRVSSSLRVAILRAADAELCEAAAGTRASVRLANIVNSVSRRGPLSVDDSE